MEVNDSNSNKQVNSINEDDKKIFLFIKKNKSQIVEDQKSNKKDNIEDINHNKRIFRKGKKKELADKVGYDSYKEKENELEHF